MNLDLADDGQYALAMSEADRIFLGYSLILAHTHTGEVEYEIATGRSKDAGDAFREGWRLTGDRAAGYVLTLAQSDLAFVLASLRLCVTHVPSDEYEIVIGRRQTDSAEELSDLTRRADVQGTGRRPGRRRTAGGGK
ncbi:MAG TPA: hypothetical protein VFI65_26165 [Streptosporangiaceae bacterium]|nr:hypothetical protein [Streptosporangiaceae bacterium]